MIVRLLFGLAVLVLGSTGVAHGQAFVGAPNTGAVDLSYTFGTSSELVESEGIVLSDVNVAHHIMGLSGTYVTPLEGLAIDAQLPVVGASYDPSGPDHIPLEGEWDDGSTHFAVTDLRAGLRYQALSHPLAVSIALAGTLPTNDYATNGYANPGHGLKALHGTVAIGRLLYPWLPSAYVHGSYEYSLVERVDEDEDTRSYNRDRSDLSFQAGYFILDELQANLAVDYRHSHGGMDYVDWDDLAESVRLHHDRLLRENILHVGGGVNYQITDEFAVGGNVRFFVQGANTLNSHLFGVLASYQIH